MPRLGGPSQRGSSSATTLPRQAEKAAARAAHRDCRSSVRKGGRQEGGRGMGAAPGPAPGGVGLAFVGAAGVTELRSGILIVPGTPDLNPALGGGAAAGTGTMETRAWMLGVPSANTGVEERTIAANARSLTGFPVVLRSRTVGRASARDVPLTKLGPWSKKRCKSLVRGASRRRSVGSADPGAYAEVGDPPLDSGESKTVSSAQCTRDPVFAEP
jgi:hypothetical protein